MGENVKQSWKDVVLLFVLAVPFGMMSGMSQLFGFWATAGIALFGALVVLVKTESGYRTNFETMLERGFGGK